MERYGFFRRLLKTKVPQYSLALGLLVLVLARAWDPPGGGLGLRQLLMEHLTAGHVSLPALAGALVLLAIAVAFTIYRWHLLLKALGMGIPAVETARLGWIGFYFNTLLPGSIGGDLVKAAVVSRQFPGRRMQAVATVLLDRGFALWNLFLFVALVSLAMPPEHSTMARLGVMARIFCGMSIIFWWALGFLPLWRAERFALRLKRWLPGVGLMVGELWLALYRYRRNPWTILGALVLSAISQTGFILSVVCVGWGLCLGESMPGTSSHFLLVPMAMMVNAIPLFPGGLGIGEWGYGTLFGMMGGDDGAGVAVSLGHRVANWLLAALTLLTITLVGAGERANGRTESDQTR